MQITRAYISREIRFFLEEVAFMPELCGTGENCLGQKGQREVVGLEMREYRTCTSVCWWLNGSRDAAGGVAGRADSSPHEEGPSEYLRTFQLGFLGLRKLRTL